MSDNSKNLSSTKDLKRVLGFWDLMAVGIGSIIGSGIMSLTGWGIDETGRSVCIAFVIGGIIAVLARSPQIFLNSVARFRGGDYSMVGTFLGPRWTGTYSMIALLTSVTLCMYALSFADYAMPFLPNVSRKASLCRSSPSCSSPTPSVSTRSPRFRTQQLSCWSSP